MALIKWLASGDRARPTRFGTALPDDGRKQEEPAWIESNIVQGSLILAGPSGDIALDWRKGDKERARGIPPGTYRLRTTRIERTEDKVHWFISSTQPPNKPIRLSADKRLELAIPDTIRFAAHAKPAGKRQLRLGFSIKSQTGQGLSIYRDGKRVPVTYTVRTAKGHRLAWGNMNYG